MRTSSDDGATRYFRTNIKRLPLGTAWRWGGPSMVAKLSILKLLPGPVYADVVTCLPSVEPVPDDAIEEDLVAKVGPKRDQLAALGFRMCGHYRARMLGPVRGLAAYAISEDRHTVGQVIYSSGSDRDLLMFAFQSFVASGELVTTSNSRLGLPPPPWVRARYIASESAAKLYAAHRRALERHAPAELTCEDVLAWLEALEERSIVHHLGTGLHEETSLEELEEATGEDGRFEFGGGATPELHLGTDAQGADSPLWQESPAVYLCFTAPEAMGRIDASVPVGTERVSFGQHLAILLDPETDDAALDAPQDLAELAGAELSGATAILPHTPQSKAFGVSFDLVAEGPESTLVAVENAIRDYRSLPYHFWAIPPWHPQHVITPEQAHARTAWRTVVDRSMGAPPPAGSPASGPVYETIAEALGAASDPITSAEQLAPMMGMLPTRPDASHPSGRAPTEALAYSVEIGSLDVRDGALRLGTALCESPAVTLPALGNYLYRCGIEDVRYDLCPFEWPQRAPALEVRRPPH